MTYAETVPEPLKAKEGRRAQLKEDSSPGLPVPCGYAAHCSEGGTRSAMLNDASCSLYAGSGSDFSGTICHCASVEDLDEEAVESFRARWTAKSGKKQLASLSMGQLLRECGAITDAGVTYAALILFGKHEAVARYLPQAEVIFEYRFSEAAGPANQREEFKAGLFAWYDRIWDLVNLRNDKQHYQEGFYVFDIPTFNECVVREAVLNAASHREYQYGGSIFVRQFRDRLVVESPGGLPLGITPDNILERQCPRNRRIASILSLCGLAEHPGRGMSLMVEQSVQETKPLPDFTGTDDFFVVVTLNGRVSNRALIPVLKRICERGEDQLSTGDFLAIDALCRGRPLNAVMQPCLKKLSNLGLVEHIGRRKYALAGSLAAAAGRPIVHPRLAGLERDAGKKLLLKRIRQNKEAGTPFRELQQVLPKLCRSQIQGLLRELKGAQKVFCEGKTHAARWFASD